MSDERRTGEKWSLPAAERARIDRLADEFEREFNEGSQPRIEAYLEQAPELCSYLLEELIRGEVELRRTAGQQPTREEYLPRFPEAQEMVNAIFSVVESSGAGIESTRDRPASPDDTDTEDEPTPEQLGRYRIERRLGRGGFGVVYLAHDPDLDRPVALKVPRRKRLQTREQVGDFIKEARTAANLKHPGLVTVHDVQQEDGWPYIVQEFIEGQNLAEWAREQKPSYEQIARLLIGIADAVGYAHQQGLTHCDLKLANVLMDTVGTPHVADFGLAMHENAQASHRGEVLGTPAMMAPEQVRGETHRFDDRTDIWAMGVMLYELLTDRRPFHGEDGPELSEDIQKNDPRPPRQIDRGIPRELDRICLRCLSKRRSDRYSTTDDLREDLQAWLDNEPQTGSSAPSAQSATDAAAPDSSSGSSIPARIIPKGLRSFDAEDTDFFLDLLPGARDRNGLPESIRFWKRRIEEDDVDKTFSVGLIYGPSGCGKSSLVKAGLLPRLGDSVVPIFVEATTADTEVRLLKQLHKYLPQLPQDVDLPAACAELRMTGAGRGRKVLLVLDQFEQWLYSHAELKGAQLVDALRQCEGSRLQAIVMVRDDFYLSVNRLFQELEIRLVEGHNQGVVDLFDPDHARRVLKAFGRAYGKLDEELSPEQEEFLTQAVAQLAEDNKIISVRLALFADMMKSRAWVPTSLEDVGGVGGVGVTFLEETFAAKTAPPSHRIHQTAVRGVLKALLPEAGTDIKGAMQSTGQLREAAEYSDQPRQFTELIHILDSEVRLITPTDPEGTGDVPAETSDTTYYQLTHDYLVPSLRDWLTRKQKETRRGRAQLRLEERSAQWNAKSENRYLPAWWEYVNIHLLTDRAKWTEPQRKMMRQANWVQGTRIAGMLFVLFACVVVSLLGMNQYRHSIAVGRVKQLLNTTAEGVPPFIELLRPLKSHAVPLLINVVEAPESYGSLQRLHAACALAEFGVFDFAFPIEAIQSAKEGECPHIIPAFQKAPKSWYSALSAQFTSMRSEPEMQARLAIILLHLGNPDPAADMLKIDGPGYPIRRTAFIKELVSWHGSIAELAEAAKTRTSGSLRSGLCLGIGSIPAADLNEHDKSAWEPLLSEWFMKARDSGTHSAAGWALRQWSLEVPELQESTVPMSNVDWWNGPLALTMIRVPKGQFARRDESAGGKPQLVKLTCDFWLSDREVTIALFQEFIDDEAYTGLKPRNWQGAATFGGQTEPNHPVQRVSWYEAVMFCNWLSCRYQLEPCYDMDAEKQDGGTNEEPTVAVSETANGFRLPTEAEWEYACRAGTGTGFCFGDGVAQLEDYGWYSVNSEGRAHPCGEKLCNAWGLFDMHGNVWEWCQDWDGEYGDARVVENPRGAEKGSNRVSRGGSWNRTARYCRSSYRVRSPPPYCSNSALGFRVARGPFVSKSESKAVGGAQSDSR